MLGIQPDVLPALNNLAWHYAHQPERRARGLQLAQRAAQLAPNDPKVADTLGWAYHLSGKREEAVRTLRRAAELDPKSAAAREHLAKATQSAPALNP